MEDLVGGQRPRASLTVLNAVQEEVGGHGATIASYRLQPDLAICIDVTHATDTPGIDKGKHGEVKLGAGPTVSHGVPNHPAIVRRLMAVADKAGIPLQHESVSITSGSRYRADSST